MEKQAKREFINNLKKMIEPVIAAEGMELLEVEFQKESNGYVLRVFIDHEDGVTIEDCSRISYILGDFLDVVDPIHHPYHLEVSSPGLDRPLSKPSHFVKYKGSIIRVKTIDPIGKRKNFKGLLIESTDSLITLKCDETIFEIPYDNIEKARLAYFETENILKKQKKTKIKNI